MGDSDKILVVDDDASICNLLAMSLSSLGEITCVHDGLDALERIDAERFNVAVLDLMLPGISGMEVFEHIRERRPQMEVILLTGHASLKTATEAVRLGAYDYITKPFNPGDLEAIVGRALEKQRMRSRLAAVRDLSREMALLLDVEEVVETVLDIADRVLDFDTCDLWLIDEDEDELYLLATRGVREEAMLRLSLDGEKGVTVAAARSGESIYVPDTREDRRYVETDKRCRSELAVPLKVKGRMIGVLNLENLEPEAFTLEDRQLISTLVAQAAVAIESARLHEQAERELEERKRAEHVLKRRIDQLELLNEVGNEIAIMLDLDNVLERVTSLVQERFGYHYVSIFTLNEGRDTLIMRTQASDFAHLPPSDYQVELQEGVVGWVGYYGKKLLVDDVDADSRCVSPYLDTMPTQSELSVPVSTGGELVGVLDVQSPHRNAFDDNDVMVMNSLADQIAVAIENARLYDQAQREIAERKQAEESIRQHARELEALNEIGQAVTSTLDLQETLALIAEHATRLMDMAATSVALCDEPDGTLHFAAAAGEGADFIVDQRLEMGRGIAGWVAEHGEPMLVPDVSEEPRWYAGFDEETGFTTRSVLCVPLRSESCTIGVIEAFNKEGGFTHNDLRVLNALATSVAAAIENARLFQEIRRGREQLKTLSRRLVEVQEAERAHVARELHDETGQALSSLLLNLSLLEKAEGCPDAVTKQVAQMEAMVDEMLENLHRLSVNLRPAALDHLGLVTALEQYVETFNRQYSAEAQFEVVGLGDERLPPKMETALYRVVQEAMTNVARHAEATCVDVLVERRGNRVVTIVEDDGVGFDPEAAIQSSRLGLLGIRERAEMLGGSLTIESSKGSGTTVFVEVPYGGSGGSI